MLTREELLDRLPSEVVIKSRNPFVAVIPPYIKLTREQRDILRTLQRDSVKGEGEKNLQWVRVKDSWQRAIPWLVEKKAQAVSLGKSLFSEITAEEVPAPLLQRRHISCFGKTLEGQVIAAPCPNLTLSKGGTHHCGGCGCGDNSLSQLEPGLVASKLLYPHLECPLKRDGFSNSEVDLRFEKSKQVVTFQPGGGGLGDCIASLWLAEGYKEKGWQVRYLPSGYDELLRAAGQEISENVVGEVWPLGGSFPPYHYETQVDKGANPRLLVWAGKMPGGISPRTPKLTLDPTTRARLYNRLHRGKRFASRPTVLLSPDVHWRERRWPLNHWFLLARLLEERGWEVAMTTIPSQKNNVEGWPLTFTDLTPLEVYALMTHCKMFVGADSGLAWLRALEGGRGIALMGPTRNIFTLFPHITEMRTTKLPCSGCHFDGAKGFTQACSTWGCFALLNLSPEQVADAVGDAQSHPLSVLASV